MGFWDSVGKAATALGSGVVDAAKENVVKTGNSKMSMPTRVTVNFINLLATATLRKQYTEGGAIRSILTSRGHIAEQINAKVRALL